MATGVAAGVGAVAGVATAAPISTGDVTVDGGNVYLGDDNEVLTDPYPDVYFPDSRVWIFTDDFVHSNTGDLHVDVYPDGDIEFPAPSDFG